VQGRVVVLTRNPIAEAIETVAATAGRKVVVVEQDDDGRGVAALAEASRPGPNRPVGGVLRSKDRQRRTSW
jgi:hypothetical protein